MKKLILLTLISAFSLINAQYKDQANLPIDYKGGIFNGNGSSFFGFFNPENFSMHHSLSMSFQTFGGGSMALGVYTNNMLYKITDNLNVEADLSLVNSPYNSFSKDFAKQINGFYLSRAQINYKPSDNTSIIFQYRQIPVTSYSPYSYYGGYGWGYSPFDSFGFNGYDVRSSGK